MNKKEVLQRIKGLDEDTQKRMVCALIDHSRIVSFCWGYITCGRCGETIGDTIASTFSLKEKVIINHKCDTCKKNYKSMGWKDKFLVDDPFKG